MSRIIAIVNQKGGVGKTTTAVNLATALAAVQRRVLLVDLDPQANATAGFGIERTPQRPSAYQLIMGEISMRDVILPTQIPNLAIVPSTMHLAGAELELVTVDNRETRLKIALGEIAHDYDYVLIDCPPSLGLLTLNALVAASSVLVPLQCEFLALEGLSNLVQTIDKVSARYNPGLGLEGIVLTMYDRRAGLSEAVANDVRTHFGAQVFETVIPRNVRVAEAPSHGLPILLYDHRSNGATAYIQLASELLKRHALPLTA